MLVVPNDNESLMLLRCEFPAELDFLDALSDCLFEAGAQGLEETPGARVTYTTEEQSRRLLGAFNEFNAALRAAFPELPVYEAIIEPVSQDYHRGWLDALEPAQVTKTFVLRPTSRPDAPQGEQTLWFSPRPSFGVGTHPTTQLAARAIEERARAEAPPPSLLDVGAGSGVLCLVACASGVPRAIGVDIENESIEAARENAQLNHLETRLEFRLGSVQSVDGQFPLIVANIDVPTLRHLAQSLVERLSPRGELLLTGLLEEDEVELTEHYEALGLARRSVERLGGWSLLTFRSQ